MVGQQVGKGTLTLLTTVSGLCGRYHTCTRAVMITKVMSPLGMSCRVPVFVLIPLSYTRGFLYPHSPTSRPQDEASIHIHSATRSGFYVVLCDQFKYITLV